MKNVASLFEREINKAEASTSESAADGSFLRAAQSLLEGHQEVLFLTTFHWKVGATMLTSFFGLTNESLLTVAFAPKVFGGFKPVVSAFNEIKYDKLVFWEFKKMKDNQGRVWGTEFSFETKHPPARDTMYKSDLAASEKFQRIFEEKAKSYGQVSSEQLIAEHLTQINRLVSEAGKSPAEKLEELSNLRFQRLLTDAEFEQAKSRILGI